MPQLVKKRRSGWAVLAAGALVASLLAVGATPAAAESENADVAPSWTACLGDALDAAGFEDVSMGGSHYDNINCLAHYGITTGRMGGTEFAPRANVTRSQMALFLSRAAAAAGIDLGDSTGQDFTDLGDTGADRVDAISRLVNSGVMSGRTATTFDPEGHVTRADMAEHLVALVAMARDDLERGDDLLYSFDDDVILDINGAPDGDSDRDIHDEDSGFFSDVYTMASAPTANAIYTAFELGITTGYSDGTFKPNRAVSRQEMASFIMRSMAHTNLRPAGLNGQRSGNSTDGYEIQISMRDADFAPVANARVDVFHTNWPAAAFEGDGSCVLYPFERVSDVQPSVNPCEIDPGDTVTDSDGNAAFSVAANGATPDDSDAVTVTCTVGVDGGAAGTYTIVGASTPIDADTTFYAWTGELTDEVSDDTDLTEITVTSLARPSRTAPTTPDHALIDGGLIKVNQSKAKFGEEVEYTLQLRAIIDNADGTTSVVNSAPDSSGNLYILTDERTRGSATDAFHLVSTPITPDENGMATFPIITQADLSAGPDDDVVVELTLTLAPNNTAEAGATGAFQDAGDNPFNSPLTDAQLATSDLELSITFSDDPAVDANHLITGSAISPWRDAPRIGSTSGNAVTVTLVDEYGDEVRGFSVRANSDLNVSGMDPLSLFSGVQYYTTNRSGQYTVGYSYIGGPATEVLTVVGDPTPADEDTTLAGHQSTDNVEATATVYWAGTGRLAGFDSAPVLAAEADNNRFVVNVDPDDTGPADVAPYVYRYDDVDSFTLDTNAVSMAEFERAITTVTAHQLTWSGYDPTRPIDRSIWDLTLACSGDN